MSIHRRRFLGMLAASTVAAPAIVRASSLMSISVPKPDKFLMVEYDHSTAVEWLEREMQNRLYKMFIEWGPVPYSEQGLNLVQGEVEGLLDEVIHPEKAFWLVVPVLHRDVA